MIQDHPRGPRQLLAPSLDPSVHLGREGVGPLPILPGPRRVELPQAPRQGLAYGRHAHRVQVHMGIAHRVDVPQGTVRGPAGVQQGHLGGGLEVAGLARQYPRIGGAGQGRREPAHLQLGPDGHHQVGPTQGVDHGRLGLEGVQVAVRGGQDLEGDAVPAQLPDQGPQAGGGGDHLQDSGGGGQTDRRQGRGGQGAGRKDAT